MRIITGSARGIPLKTLAGEATRPTAEKVKEAVFSAIQFDIEGRSFLDLFAGSGQMGLEALSRGAANATFIDASAEAIAIVKENAKKTGFFEKSHFLISDYRNYLRKAAGRESFDLIFIDPPYAEKLAADAADRIVRAGIAKRGALFIAESEEEDIFAQAPAIADKFEIIKVKKYGRAYITVFRRAEADILSEADEAQGEE